MIYRCLLLTLMLLCSASTEANQEACKPFFTKGKKIALVACGTVALGGLAVIVTLIVRQAKKQEDTLRISEPTLVSHTDAQLLKELEVAIEGVNTEQELEDRLNTFRSKGQAYAFFAFQNEGFITEVKHFQQLVRDAKAANINANLICDKAGNQNTKAFMDMLVLRAVVGNGQLTDTPSSFDATTKEHVQLLEHALKYGGNPLTQTPRTDTEQLTVHVFDLAVSKCQLLVGYNKIFGETSPHFKDLTFDRQLIQLLLQYKADKYKDDGKWSKMHNVNMLMQDDVEFKTLFEEYGYIPFLET